MSNSVMCVIGFRSIGFSLLFQDIVVGCVFRAVQVSLILISNRF